MKLWFFILTIALLSSPPASAQQDRSQDAVDGVSPTPMAEDASDDERDTIITLLSHHHEVPDRRTLKGVTDDARAIVFAIADDEEAFPFHRHRALRALTHWPDEEVYQYLRALLVDEKTDDALRHHLLPILADGFGDRALSELERFVRDAEDPQVRVSAVEAIASVATDDARQTLAKALDDEDHPLVVRRLQSHLSKLR